MKKGILIGMLLCIGVFSNAAIIDVTNTNDSGAGSLRQAISDANSMAGTDIIDATGVTGTITLLSALPNITESVTINGPTVGNLILDAGGGFRVLHLSSGANVINYLTITNGATSTTYGGAGIYNTGTSLILDHCIISNNTNTSISGNRYAGGIYSEGILNITYCRVTNNSCSIPNGEFFGNQAGGGIYLAGYSVVNISNCLIDNNSLNGGTNKNGGGIAFDDNNNFTSIPGSLEITNSTISGNSINNGSNNRGSGISIENFNNATILITQSTIAYNVCQGGSNNYGAFSNQGFGTDPIIQSNIFSNNTPENIEAFSTMTSLGYNIKDDNSGFYNPHPTDLDNTDPLLLPLQDNGGFTYTHAIQCYSPAIDNGIGLISDQRDSTIYGSGRDRGAFELQPLYGVDEIITCDSYTWLNGITYTANVYGPTFTVFNANGCDSLVTLDLTILNSATGTDTRTECNAYTWIDGNTYNASNNSATFNIVGGAANGCDSLVTLDLTILNSATGTDTRTECNAYTWIDGNTYNASNNSATFNIVGGAANGCDSLVTLDLTINNVSDLTTTVSGLTITSNNSNATYQWIDCDNGNSEINGEIGQSFTATQNGNYAVELTENGCIDTTSCVAITTVGIEENSFGNKLIVYPNPTDGNFSIDLGSIYESSVVSITDISGKLIDSKTISQSQVLNLSIGEPAGIYIVSIQAGDKNAVIRLIKE